MNSTNKPTDKLILKIIHWIWCQKQRAEIFLFILIFYKYFSQYFSLVYLTSIIRNIYGVDCDETSLVQGFSYVSALH